MARENIPALKPTLFQRLERRFSVGYWSCFEFVAVLFVAFCWLKMSFKYWCKSCGICMELCPREVLGSEVATKRVILIAPDKCNGCGLCELACPDYVFAIEELENILA